MRLVGQDIVKKLICDYYRINKQKKLAKKNINFSIFYLYLNFSQLTKTNKKILNNNKICLFSKIPNMEVEG